MRDGTHDSPKSQYSGYPLVTSKHLLPYDIDLSSPNKINEKDFNKINERSKVDAYDILMSMIGTVGIVSFVSQTSVEFAIKNVALFKTSRKKDFAYFLLMYLKNSSTKQYIESCLAGSTQQYISLAELRKMPFWIPSETELNKLNMHLSPLITRICENVKENKILSKLREAILPRLMSGEIDVSKIEI